MEFYPLPRMALFAEAKGFTASSWGEITEATATDGEIGVSFSMSKNLVLTTRYRISKLEFDVAQTKVDLDLSGFSLALDLRF